MINGSKKGKVTEIKRPGVEYNAETEKGVNAIGKRLAEARKQHDMSLVAFSKHLKSYGVSVGDAALSKWENGVTVPNAYQFIAICCALGLEDEATFFMSDYQPVLNETGRQKLAEYKADLVASGNYKPESKQRSSIRYIEMPVSFLSVSAGTGAFLDEGNFEMVRFPETSVPEGAEFGIRVSGDSMEPVYHDGQIVWVQQCDQLHVGEVGIMVYDGEGYLKAYDEQEPEEEFTEQFTDSSGQVRPQRVMVSYNEAYEPRRISPFASFQVVGRVLKN